jgi:hypothetical protein
MQMCQFFANNIVYDRYDLLHNSHLNLNGLHDLFKVSKVNSACFLSSKHNRIDATPTIHGLTVQGEVFVKPTRSFPPQHPSAKTSNFRVAYKLQIYLWPRCERITLILTKLRVMLAHNTSFYNTQNKNDTGSCLHITHHFIILRI